MKKYYTIILMIIISFCSLNAQLIEEWDLIFEKSGRLLASDSLHFGIIQSKAIYFTSNGGKTWDDSLVLSYKDSFHLNFNSWTRHYDNYIYCLADSVVSRGIDENFQLIYDYKANIFKSTDRGKSWQTITINKNWRSRRSTVLSMCDSLNGIMMQFPSKYEINELSDRIWHTNDGWNSWELIPTPDEMKACNKALFILPGTIVAVSDAFKKIYKTTDLGKTWIITTIPDSIKNLNSKISIFNSSIYFLRKDNTLYRTTNSGKNWDIFFENDEPIGLIIINDSTLYFSGNNPKYLINGSKVIKSNNFYNNFEYKLLDIIQFSENNKIARTGGGTIKFTGNKTLKLPYFISPDSVFDRPLDFELKWDSIIGATYYHLQIVQRIGNPFDSIGRPPATFDTVLFVNEPMIAGTSYKLTGTGYYKEYTCRIRAYNDTFSSPWLSKVYWTENEPTNINDYNAKNDSLSLFPNPLRNGKSLKFNFVLNKNSYITIFLINNLGIKIGKTIKDYFSSGHHTLRYITKTNLPSGTYWLLMTINNKETIVKPVVIIK